MAIEKLQAYIEATAEFEKAHAKVAGYGKIIANVAGYLNNFPYKMSMSNVGVSFTATADREYILNADTWPTAKQLAEVLSDYLSKRSKVKFLYDSLSREQKEQIKSPPNI